MSNGKTLGILALWALVIGQTVSGCDMIRKEAVGDSIYVSYDHTMVPYSFTQPDTVYTLDIVLEEVSGITALPDGNMAVVEDENGIIYILNPSGKILEEITFGDPADYEAIEYYDGIYYIFESNGELHAVQTDGDTVTSDKVSSPFKGKNDIEGLGILNGELLVAPKGEGEVASYKASEKAVYLLDLKGEEITKQLLKVTEDDLEELIKKRLPEVKITDFDPSGIAVNPVDGNIYLLSADMILTVFSSDGNLLEVVLLDSVSFRQPEGLCFMEDGTLFIVSESGGDMPTLARYSRK
jgi:uncharacterized protein YjiK